MHRVIVGCLLASLFAGVAHSSEPAGRMLVTPAWLADHLQDSSLVVLHVASLRADYEREHIPGARFLWASWLAESTPEGSVEMPPLKTIDAVLETLGVSNGSHVVLYHDLGNIAAAARAYIGLDYADMGDRTSILDGGLDAWKEEGRPVTRDVPVYAPGVFEPQVRNDVIADLEYVKAARGKPGVRLVDGRSARGFNVARGVNIFRGGHIPGAINIPFSAVTDTTGRYLPPDALRARFEAAGVEPGDEIITSCYVGRAASPVYVAAKMLGFDVRLYDGSFEEWSRQEDLPVEVTPAKTGGSAGNAP